MRARNHLIGLGVALGVFVALASGGVWIRGRDQERAVPDATAVPSPTVSLTAEAPSPTPSRADAPSGEAVAVLRSAQELFREGRHADARAAFLRLADDTRTGVDRAEALVGAGNAARALNDLEGAADAYREAARVTSPGSPLSARAYYLLLKALNDAEESEEAAAVFRGAPQAAAGSPLEPYYRFEGGRADWWPAGNAIWAGLLSDATVSPALKTTIRHELVARWRDRGDIKGLTPALDDLIADTGEPAARLERAELALANGDVDTAAFQLRAIVIDDPASIYAGFALERLDSNGLAVDPGAAGLSFYRRGQYLQAIEMLRPAVESAPTANDLAFRAFYVAAANEDLGRAAEAVAYYDRAAGSGATNTYVHRATYWAARVTEATGAAQGASQRYASLVLNGPPGEFTRESAFRAGFVLLEAGNPAGALAVWQTLVGAESARLEYWRGRALNSAGDRAGATAAYERAIALGPLDLHGLEAARELGRAPRFDVRYVKRDLSAQIDWAAISSWLSSRIGGRPAGAPATAACEFANAGLQAAAAAEIEAARRADDPWRTFELMREASECGLTNVAAQLAVALRISAGVESNQPPPELLRVAYPLDYGSTLEEQARKAGIDPLFLASLIRQESFWDPSAKSAANAFGLTQVIPPTGAALAAELGVEDFVPEMLLGPALSIEFGAHYLGGQIARYNNPLFALAAYNAGPGNANRWQASGAVQAADVVEVVDFLETRSYVTYIVEAYAHYQLAWAR